MKALLLFFCLLAQAGVASGISVDEVLATLRRQTVAANSGDLKGLVATVPERGLEIRRKGAERPARITREEMTGHLEAYFKTIRPGTYLYAVRLCSVDGKDADTLTVTLEVHETYQPVASDEVTTSSYRESVVLGTENGKVVVLRSSMEDPETGKLRLPR